MDGGLLSYEDISECKSEPLDRWWLRQCTPHSYSGTHAHPAQGKMADRGGKKKRENKRLREEERGKENERACWGHGKQGVLYDKGEADLKSFGSASHENSHTHS